MLFNTLVATLALAGAVANARPLNYRMNYRRATVDLGKCSDPSVKFGPGLDGRKATEFSFINNNQKDFQHGSALNPDIIFQFTCDTFVNKCGFKNGDPTVNTCRDAQKKAAALGKVGAAADTFNAAFGIKTKFAALDKSGSGAAAGAGNGGAAPPPAATNAAANCQATVTVTVAPAAATAAPENCPAPVTVTVAAAATATAAPDAGAAAPAANGALNFGTCTDPSVKFGPGLDGRKATEFSFINNNQKDFQHGSALNPDIIFQFTCDTFVNRCGLKQTDATVTTCRDAQKKAGALGKTGAAADSFNAALGIKTNFAALDNGGAANGAQQNQNQGQQQQQQAAPANGALNFGTCTDPSVKFGPGLDGRKATEFSFINNNQKDFQHGSALNPDIIFQFTCDTFVNRCGLKQTDATVTTCRDAQKKAAALGKVGAAADSFNAALGIQTNFAAIKA
jgi:hypothetical protein